MVACIALVVGFRESANLAGAYGLAVSTTMTITTDRLLPRRPRAVRLADGPSPRRCAACSSSSTSPSSASTLFKIPHGGLAPARHRRPRVHGPVAPGAPAAGWSASASCRAGSTCRALRREPHRPPARCAHPARRPTSSPGRGITPPALIAALRHTDVLPRDGPRRLDRDREGPAGARRPVGPRSPTSGTASTRSCSTSASWRDPDVPAALAGRGAS